MIVSFMVVALAACSSAPAPSTGSDGAPGSPDAPAGGDGPASPGGQLGGTTTPPPPAAGDGCSDAARLVYVVSDANDLYSFAPDKLAFTKIGALGCVAGGDRSPNSMAVDRSGTAWVNYDDDSIFEVSTKDASCKPTSFVPKQGGVSTYGMAFATASAGSTEDGLFVVRADDAGGHATLAKLDVGTLALAPVGGFSGALAGIGGELTGTGDGRLYGFFSTRPNATLAQIDEAAAATSGDKTLQNLRTGDDFAFSFWGGDFWFYTSDGDHPSSVTRLKTSGDGSQSTVLADVGGFRIVGAGVSTCAPVTPPTPN